MKTGRSVGESFGLGLQLHQAGELGRAALVYRQILAAQPDHADALHMLGLLSLQAGHHDTAHDYLRRALAITPKVAEAHNHLGLTLQALNRPGEAEAAYRKAIALDRACAPAWLNLANLMAAGGRGAEAIATYRKTLALAPRDAAAHFNLAALLASRNDMAGAEAAYRQALAIAPDDAGAHTALAALLHRHGRLDAAIEHYRRAAILAPHSAAAAMNLALGLRDLGRTREAAHAAITAHALAPGDAACKTLLADCLKALGPIGDDPVLAAHLSRAIAEGWDRPQQLAPEALAMVRADRDPRSLFALEGSPTSADDALRAWLARDVAGAGPLTALLMLVLGAAVIADLMAETFFTAVRRRALHLCTSGAAVGSLGLSLLCGLAMQCCLTEYAWAETDEETDLLTRLQQRIVAGRVGNGALAPEWLAVLASYRPLETLPAADDLPAPAWPAALQSCLTQQIAEPAQEAALLPALPRLTAIRDPTSQRVRAQYEANPYPRWTGTVLTIASAALHAALREALPGIALDGAGPPAPEILVAGCGTGQHPIETARRFANSRVLAVDLSMRSLAYAQRKTREAGIDTITYAQADLLELAGLAQRFDVIEAMGVLHHLEDPEQGWRTLVGLLRPGGFMKIGLYSALARAPIVRVRREIAARGYGTSAAEIRRFRQDMRAILDDEAVKTLLAAPDFYSISGCRDLLFHTSEHHVSLPEIAATLDRLGLTFLGFERPPAPDAPPTSGPDGTALLARWDAYERAHPDAFQAMYQFWVRLPAAPRAI